MIKKEFEAAYQELIQAKRDYEMFEVFYIQKEVNMAGSKLFQQARNAEERSRTMTALMSDAELHGEDLVRKRAELKLNNTLAYYKFRKYEILLGK